MKDEQLFIDKFNEIIEDVSRKYKPSAWTIREINDTLESIIAEIEEDIDVVGIPDLIKLHNKDLEKRIDLLRTSSNVPIQGIPLHGTPAQKEDYKFSVEFWVKAYRFIIEYLEGLKPSEPINKAGGRPKKSPPDTAELTFNSMFTEAEYIEPCLDILRGLDPPYIDINRKYIGNNKGIFPLWIRELKAFKSVSLLKYMLEPEYGRILNNEIIGLNLSKDFKEFRNDYKMLTKRDVRMDIKTLLSKSFQKGKLGK